MDYILENNNLRAVVRSTGAELVSVINKATGEEMMWDAQPEIWGRNAPVLFPYCGRLKDGSFTHKGVSYQGGQHGFARDMEHALVEQQPEQLTLCLEANALTMEKFPFAFALRTTYRLCANALYHEIEVLNDGDEPMSFGFGYHPGFACPFDAQHSAQDYSFVFDTPQTPTVVVCSETTGLTTGQTYAYKEGEPITEIPLTNQLFDHDSICFSGLTCKTLSLVEKASGRRITLGVEGFPYVLLWSTKGPVRFACIEPWHTLPDAETASGEWSEKTPSITLEPGTQWRTVLPMQFAR